MIRKILAAIVLVPLAIVIIGLAVANRQIVSISFDPFNAAAPAFALKAPLFVLVFILVTAGVIIGGCAAWLKQAKWRRAARALDAELRQAQAELAVLKRGLGESEESATSMRWPPPRALQPPAA
jgi:uncharacterized membrane protein YciS (DUF1049 family)